MESDPRVSPHPQTPLNSTPWYLRDVDPPLLEGAGGGVVGAQVPVLAPVAAEGTVHTGQAPGGERGKHSLSTSTGLQPCQKFSLPGKIIPLVGVVLIEHKTRNGFGKPHTLQRQTWGCLTVYPTAKCKLGFSAHPWIGVK